MNKKDINFDFLILIATLLIYLLFYLMLTRAFIFWEVSWHIEGAKRMLDGGNYLINLYDDNPPAVFMFYIPYVALSRLLSLPNINFAFVYILSIYAITSYFSYQALKNSLLGKRDKCVLYFASIIAVLLFGINFIGQRESNFFCLLIPYLYVNLFDNRSITKLKQLAIAALGAIGVSQAPFYIIVSLFIDLIDCIVQRKKPQTYQSMFYVFFAAIFALSYFLYPDYYNFVLDLVYHFQSGINQGIRIVISQSFFLSTVICFFIVLTTYLVFYRRLIYLKIVVIFLSTLLIYIIEQKPWVYHIYPAIGVAVLAFAVIYNDSRAVNSRDISQRIIKMTFSIIFVLLLAMNLSISLKKYIGNFSVYHGKASTLGKLMTFSKATNFPRNTTLFFHTRVFPTYLLKFYGKLNIISPWANNWMLPTLVNFQGQSYKIKNFSTGKKMLFHLTQQSLIEKRPKYIVYYQGRYTPYINKQDFDIIDYLRQNKAIHHELEKYNFYRRIDTFVILKRKNEK